MMIKYGTPKVCPKCNSEMRLISETRVDGASSVQQTHECVKCGHAANTTVPNVEADDSPEKIGDSDSTSG